MKNYVLGPLTSIAADPHVTDIAVTSDGRVWADTGNGMVERSLEVGLLSSDTLRDFAIHICASLGKRLDDSSPIADASTPDGLRVHAVLEPIVAHGASLSIRLPHNDLNTLDDLCTKAMMPREWEELITQLVVHKKSILISGGTGAGKTTLVKAILGQIDESERVVLVEEIRELSSVRHLNRESLVVRDANVEGAGEITLSDLVKATVRMRPDRIVLGECRGEEVSDLLRALNSGHKGSIATIHADSIERVPARLSALGLLAHIDIAAMNLLAAGAFDVLIHVERTEVGRHIAQIGTLELDKEGRLQGKVLAQLDGEGRVQHLAGYDEWAQNLMDIAGAAQDETREFSVVAHQVHLEKKYEEAGERNESIK